MSTIRRCRENNYTHGHGYTEYNRSAIDRINTHKAWFSMFFTAGKIRKQKKSGFIFLYIGNKSSAGKKTEI